MDILIVIAFIALAVAPLVIAMRYGDRLLDALQQKMRTRKKSARRRRTQSLPIRSEEVDRLLTAESKRDALDDRIAAGLESFARLSSTQTTEDAESEFDLIEQAILARESQFGAYLDYAWYQSETIEILSDEAKLLRQLVDLPEEGLPTAPASPATPSERPRLSAPNKLMANLESAIARKSKVDQKLGQVGKVTGGRFDMTIGDDSDT